MKGTTTGVRAGKLILIIARNYILAFVHLPSFSIPPRLRSQYHVHWSAPPCFKSPIALSHSLNY